MNKEFDVMAAGHLCLDIIPRFPDTGVRSLSEIMRPGKLVRVEEAAISTGGPVSNTGVALKKLGQRVCFCARIGNDDFGRLIAGGLGRILEL
jgi:sugar/nucleoside kinase (ribokinase family)